VIEDCQNCRNIQHNFPTLHMLSNEYVVPQHYPNLWCRSHFDVLSVGKVILMGTFLKYGMCIRFVSCHSCALIVTSFGIFSDSQQLFDVFFLRDLSFMLVRSEINAITRYDVSFLPIDAWRRLIIVYNLCHSRRFTNESKTLNNGRIDRIPPRFVTGNIRFTFFFFFIFKSTYTDFLLDLRGCPNSSSNSSLAESRISRDNKFLRLLSEYFVGYLPFHEIVAMWISYVVLAPRRAD